MPRAGARAHPGECLIACTFATLLFTLLAQQRFPREPDLVALDGKDFDQDLIAELELIADVADAGLGYLADVQQPIGAGEDFDEGAEFGQAHDLAEISLADLDRKSTRLNSSHM